jgi:hypothetical protein
VTNRKISAIINPETSAEKKDKYKQKWRNEIN